MPILINDFAFVCLVLGFLYYWELNLGPGTFQAHTLPLSYNLTINYGWVEMWVFVIFCISGTSDFFFKAELYVAQASLKSQCR